MSVLKKIIILSILLFVIVITDCINFVIAEDKQEKNEIANVFYKTHVQDIGWQNHVTNGAISGTEGQGKRLEAIQIRTLGLSEKAKIKYQVHIENIGWQEWKENSQLAGTEGQSLRLEAIRIKLENEEKLLREKQNQQNRKNIGEV